MIHIHIPIRLLKNGEKNIYYDNCHYTIEPCDFLPPKNECNELIENLRNLFTPPTTSSPHEDIIHSEKDSSLENKLCSEDTKYIDINDNNDDNELESILSEENNTQSVPPPSPPDPLSFILKTEIENRPKIHSQNITFRKNPKKIHRFTSKIRYPISVSTSISKGRETIPTETVHGTDITNPIDPTNTSHVSPSDHEHATKD